MLKQIRDKIKEIDKSKAIFKKQIILDEDLKISKKFIKENREYFNDLSIFKNKHLNWALEDEYSKLSDGCIEYLQDLHEKNIYVEEPKVILTFKDGTKTKSSYNYYFIEDLYSKGEYYELNYQKFHFNCLNIEDLSSLPYLSEFFIEKYKKSLRFDLVLKKNKVITKKLVDRLYREKIIKEKHYNRFLKKKS